MDPMIVVCIAVAIAIAAVVFWVMRNRRQRRLAATQTRAATLGGERRDGGRA